MYKRQSPRRARFLRLIDFCITQLKAQGPHLGPVSRVIKKNKDDLWHGAGGGGAAGRLWRGREPTTQGGSIPNLRTSIPNLQTSILIPYTQNLQGEAVRRLVDFGADVNRPIAAIDGETTLHHGTCPSKRFLVQIQIF